MLWRLLAFLSASELLLLLLLENDEMRDTIKIMRLQQLKELHHSRDAY